jgi:hypothetical protein
MTSGRPGLTQGNRREPKAQLWACLPGGGRLFLPCVLGLLLSPLEGLAQDPTSPDRVVTALRLGSGDAIRLDGVLDEPIWKRAAVATGFLQRDPDNGAPATESTEVRLVYDTDRLVLGIVLHDSEPERILGNQMQRDQSFGADDRFMWTIDSFLDGRSGYYFEINPSGAMGDGLVDPSQGGDSDLGMEINKSWDGIWLARVRRTQAGWTAEIEIPFRTLNFDRAASAWGINFQRTVRRKNENSLWTGYLLNQGLARMSNAGRVEGLDGLSQGLGLDLKPYVVGNVSSAPGRGQRSAHPDGDVGIDAFYNVTPALRANLSVNTDFAETEVDERRVNLTRFPLFFEEKRDFFLEGSSFFDFAREPDEAVMPFFSRRIGRDDNGAPQRIDFGAKLTGQAGAFDVGVLQVRTGHADSLAGEDFSVLRLRRRAFQQSYFGGLYTRRSARVPGSADLHTAGVDFELRTSTFRGNRNVDVSGFYVQTSDPLAAGNRAAYGLRASYPNDPVTLEMSVREIQPNYDPAVGFVERRGYRRVNPRVDYAPRFRNHPWIQGLEFRTDLDIQHDADNRALTRDLQFRPIEINFRDGSEFGIDVSRQYQRLEEDFEISDGVILPFGAVYEFTRYRFSGNTADQYVVGVEAEVEIGDFFSGRRQDYLFQIGVRPRRGVALALEAEHNQLELAEGRFDANVFRVTANTQVSPWISLVNNLQYDTVSRELGWQMRFRWIRRPGNDLYVVYTHNWNEIQVPERRMATLDTRLATKLVYTLRF